MMAAMFFAMAYWMGGGGPPQPADGSDRYVEAAAHAAVQRRLEHKLNVRF